MDQGLREDTKLRIDEIEDLAGRMAADPNASDADLRRWLGEIKDRLTLLRNVLGVALDDGGTPVNDTGSLPEYLPDWDLPDHEAAAKNGVTEQMVNAVKIALESKGIKLQHPSDPKYHGGGRHNVGSGPLPADWEERIRTGQPLS